MSECSKDKKVDVLLEALKERYNAQHKIRARVHNIGIAALTALLTVSGWVFQANIHIQFIEKTIIVTVVCLATYVLQVEYLEDLERGFKNQMKVGAKIEDALGLYESDRLSDSSGQQIYPSSWKDAGKDAGSGNFFFTNRLLLALGVGVLILVITLKGSLL